MTDSYLPRYNVRPGEQVFGPPYAAVDARLHLFFVDANVDKLNELLDGSLNRVIKDRVTSAPVFQASRQRIIFLFAEINQMYSNADEYIAKVKAQPRDERLSNRIEPDSMLTKHDWVREVELGVWVPVSRTAYGTPVPGFYLPFVFNDSPASVVTGREVYGYPKQLADITINQREGVPRDQKWSSLDSVQLDTWHIPRPEGAPAERTGMEYKNSRLLEIDLSGQAEEENAVAPDGEVADWAHQATSGLGDAPDPGRPRLRFVSQASVDPQAEARTDRAVKDFAASMVRSAPLYFLRQFRDPENPVAATVQQVVQARFVIQSNPSTTVRTGGKLHFSPSYTLPLMADLGLAGDADAVDIQQTTVIEDLTFTVDLGHFVT